MNTKSGHVEKGQSLIIIALTITAFFAMLALVIDGGISYANRRSAQNAADAGALAGAYTLCNGYGSNAAISQAIDYATNKNNATSATVSCDVANQKVSTTANISHQTFFASILGRQVITVTADASAGCFNPCYAEHVLPVSWACKAPAGEVPGLNVCGVKDGTLDLPGPTYIVMDNVKTETEFCRDAQLCLTDPTAPECIASGSFYCDFPPADGINENISPGDQGWLNLNGGNPGASEITDWIVNGYPYPIRIHSWKAVKSGEIANLYRTVTDNLLGKIVLIPVVDDICDGIPETTCPDRYHFVPVDDSGLIDETTLGTGNGYLHISNLSAFKITCVYEGKNKENPIPPATQCTGANAFLGLNSSVNPANYRSIEGFFVNDYQPGFVGKCGLCDGVSPCTIFLDK